MKKQFIVTVKLPKNPKHDPRNKVTGICPATDSTWCTDSTGEHHTMLFTAPWDTWDVHEVRSFFAEQMHVTRVEEV